MQILRENWLPSSRTEKPEFSVIVKIYLFLMYMSV